MRKFTTRRRRSQSHKYHYPRRAQLAQRSTKICATILAIGIFLPATVSTTLAAFTNISSLSLGTNGTVGGLYDIALLDRNGNIHQGNPVSYTIDTSSAGIINIIGSPQTATFDISVVTLTEASGPVTLQLFNAFQGTRPPDPGFPTGAEPYNVALFTISVDGITLRTATTAAAINSQPIILTDWVQNVPRVVTISINMPAALGNPYFYNRILVLGVQFNGSTS
ncbi:hypothetical protein [Lysinibacter sp. HNR]|uniref:hypothetical protein n=1 Tax=Lysinibacter sp. HNR TaxID=3031408 RepID=UPI002435E42C|nr:hypothetical protein [Lysinibacter sp. HNR]WGD36796.1 hypothetical protein FrondiHNR_10070 [Lysinibacter sp. HNR]